MTFLVKPSFKKPIKTGKGKGKPDPSRAYMKRGVRIVPMTYPDNWGSIKKAVDKRDNSTCFYCGRNKKQLAKLGRWLERHHLVSVKKGNNRKTNLVSCCNVCHSRQPKHSHLKNRTKK